MGHGQLLLRSVKTDTEPTRIDILFKAVRAMKLRTTLEGLRVQDADAHEGEAIARETGEPPKSDLRFFVIESRGFRGYVVASAMATVEDEGDYNDPSQFPVQ